MNRLVIIGNGFDMAHGFKTSYVDFINWYWDQRVYAFAGNTTNVSEDCLCRLVIKDNVDIKLLECFCLHPLMIFLKTSIVKKDTQVVKLFSISRISRMVFSIECCPIFQKLFCNQ